MSEIKTLIYEFIGRQGDSRNNLLPLFQKIVEKENFLSEESLMMGVEKEASGSHLTSEAAETPIENLDLSVRVFNSLKRTGITNVGDVLELLEKGDEAVMSIRNFGEKSLEELRLKMHEKGFLRDEEKDVES